MDKIQLLFFFLSGFLVSRLIIKVKLPEKMVQRLIGERHLSLTKILLYLLGLSAFLSFFIPNAITVLTLLPLLELLRISFEESLGEKSGIATMFALTAIYGANIGGMGSVTATPANGILVTFTELNRVAGTELLTFALWLVWGIPLVILVTIAAWLIMVGVFRTWRFSHQQVRLAEGIGETAHPWQRLALGITVLYFISSLLLSILIMQYPARSLEIVAATALFTLALVLYLFRVPVKIAAEKRYLLTIPDCYSNLPTRGFFFVGIAIVVAGVLYFFNIDEYFAAWVSGLMPKGISVFLFLLTIALITSFATEVLSNTAVQLSMFVIILPLTEDLHFAPVLALLIATLSSTSAFMSPIATGVNGLAFGGVKGVSFTRMLLVGFFMNIAGAIIIAFWVAKVVAMVLGVK